MTRSLGTLVLAALLVAIGLLGGWYAAVQDAGGDDAAESAGGPPVLTPQALANLGVRVGPAKLSTFTRHLNVQAQIVDAPLNTFPVAVPVGGIVTAVHVRPGRVVEKGAPLVEIARAPIPRPTLSLTAEILTPVSENLHESVSRLRAASAEFEIAQAEYRRVQEFGRDVLPAKTLIDLGYSLARAKQAKQNAEHELERHGLSEEEIERVRDGARAPSAQRLWRRALEENGLWGPLENRVLAALPERDRGHAWSIAAIGELSAAGLLEPELALALARSAPMRNHFVEVASMLLGGHTVQRIEFLAELGALEHVVTLRAPDAAADWDVEAVRVRKGQHVAAGDEVVVLHDPREMWLRLEPVGEELAYLARAFDRGTPFTAAPLIEGAGPVLEDLRVFRFDTRGGERERGALAYVVVRNEAVARSPARSWRLRVGLRYLVAVPLRTLEDRFVVPAGAVTSSGAERVMFLQDGATFKTVSVHVEYEDDEVAVIANDGAIFKDDTIVLTGAFALGLALQSGGAADPHAGHGHPH